MSGHRSLQSPRIAKKPKGPARRSGTGPSEHLTRLCSGDAFSLIAFRALFDLEFDRLAFVQRLISVHLNGGEVNEHVFARLALDKSIAFRCIKPLHCSLFSAQLRDSSIMSGRYLPGVTPVGGRKMLALRGHRFGWVVLGRRTPTVLLGQQKRAMNTTKWDACLGIFPFWEMAITGGNLRGGTADIQKNRGTS
jgi:hypothetical protein